jgi:hypothetical protein
VFGWLGVARSLAFYAVFCRSLFVPLLCAIVLSVPHRCIAPHYLFGIFKLFLALNKELMIPVGFIILHRKPILTKQVIK